jgi:hypothetical protein
MIEQFIDPTPKSRRNLVLLYFGFAALLVLVRYVILPGIVEHMKLLPKCEQVPWLRNSITLALVFMVVLTLPYVVYAMRIYRLQQYPLPDAWVWNRTPVIRGRSASFRACSYCAIPILAITLSLVFWSLFLSMETLRMPPDCNHNSTLDSAASLRWSA